MGRNMMTKRLKFAVLIGAALAFTGCAAIQNAVETSAISDGKVGLSEFSNLSSTSDQSVDNTCLLYTSPSPRDEGESRMPSSA